MTEKEISFHYNEFLEIRLWVDEKLNEKNLDPTNPKHNEQIKDIIKESVLEFKRCM